MCSYRNKAGEGHEITYNCDTCTDKPRMHLGRCFINYRKKNTEKILKDVMFKDVNVYKLLTYNDF